MSRLLLLCLVGTLFIGCYSFQGIVIDKNVNTYFVAQFENRAPSVVPTLAPDFTEKMKDKIRLESRLIYSDTDPDVEFRATITQFQVTSEAPQPGEQIGFNKLTISASVEYLNYVDETQNDKFNVSWYAEFGADENLLSVQDELIDQITDQLVEDIFTKAFTNW
jgi:hypothetical protein